MCSYFRSVKLLRSYRIIKEALLLLHGYEHELGSVDKVRVRETRLSDTTQREEGTTEYASLVRGLVTVQQLRTQTFSELHGIRFGSWTTFHNYLRIVDLI